ncbi:MAG: KH domain-containing protein [Bacilli bacterium]|nr:KH domain-containing protein [Bacilli bacterium]
MERDYEAILHPVIDPLVHNPDAIIIRELPGSTKRDVTILIAADDDDTARLIGKRGAVANALREVIGIASKADDTNQHIHLKFESFHEEEEQKDDGK